jgi:glycerophosphoryl diester phosphodiesterase
VAFVTILGHRGFPRDAPENSLSAFAAAAAAGADGVELDARRGTSGEVLVHHDPLPVDVPSHVPTLQAALEACTGLIVNVEIKNLPTEPGWDPDETVAHEVAALVEPLGHRIVVSAFTLASVDAVRAVAPDVRTGWLTLPSFDQAAAVDTAVERGHRAIHPHHSAVTAELVQRAHAAGLTVAAWTVDDPARMTELAAMGVDTIITNRPDLAVATLR